MLLTIVLLKSKIPQAEWLLGRDSSWSESPLFSVG